MIKYSWNYALLLSKGPSMEALVPSPLYTGMKKGMITRFEEITRTPAEIQDSLISILSDKVLHIPELEEDGIVFAKPGFNVIGTAEAVSVYYQTMISGYYYENGAMKVDTLVQNLVGAVTKENKDNLQCVKDYFATVIKDKSKKEGGLWNQCYEARKWLV